LTPPVTGSTSCWGRRRRLFNQVFRDGFFHADFIRKHVRRRLGGDRRRRFRHHGGSTGDPLLPRRRADRLSLRRYRRVAEVHFAAATAAAPIGRRLRQACRAIGEPILASRCRRFRSHAYSPSSSRSPSQFEMRPSRSSAPSEDDGAGRGAGPPPRSEVNIDAARAPDRGVDRDNRGPEARLRQRFDTLAEMIDGDAGLIRSLETLVADWSAKASSCTRRPWLPRQPSGPPSGDPAGSGVARHGGAGRDALASSRAVASGAADHGGGSICFRTGAYC